MTLIVKFHIKDKTLSIVKIVTDMQVYDYSIEVPLLITSLYGFSLVISKTSECFPKKIQNQTLEGQMQKKSPLHDFVFLPLMGQGLK